MAKKQASITKGHMAQDQVGQGRPGQSASEYSDENKQQEKVASRGGRRFVRRPNLGTFLIWFASLTGTPLAPPF